MPDHHKDFLLTPIIAIYAAARAAGYRLVWCPQRRCVILRRTES